MEKVGEIRGVEELFWLEWLYLISSFLGISNMQGSSLISAITYPEEKCLYRKLLCRLAYRFFYFSGAILCHWCLWRRLCCSEKSVKVGSLHFILPQLIAGPIVKYRDIAEQIDHRTASLKQTVWGIRRFIYGLSKKVLVSNVMAACADSIYDHGISDMTSAMALAASLCYTMQIYYDFSGYSDMAIGLGKMFGFEFKENFNYPYHFRFHSWVLETLTYFA